LRLALVEQSAGSIRTLDKVGEHRSDRRIDVVEIGVEPGFEVSHLVVQVRHEFLGRLASRDRDGGARQSACTGSEDDVGAGGVVEDAAGNGEAA
jgi:hypothetical protein